MSCNIKEIIVYREWGGVQGFFFKIKSCTIKKTQTLDNLPLPGVGVLTTVGCGVLGLATAFIRGFPWGTAVGVRAWEGGRSYFCSCRR